MLTPAIMRRFQSKVQQGGPNECWPWMAGTFKRFGYGQFNAGRYIDGRQDTRYAHRVAFQAATGIDPQDAVVMHTCDNPPCCNPAHLKLGTQAENVQDAAQKGHYSGPRPFSRARKLTDGDVAAIRLSHAKGVDLARAYRVTPATITNIRNHRRRAA